MNDQVERTSEFLNDGSISSVYYRTSCQCWTKDHDLNIELEYDKELGITSMIFYVMCNWNADWNFNWFKRFYRRIKASIKLLLTGKIQLEHDFIFRDKKHIEGLFETLQDGIKKIENNKSKGE